MEKKKDYFIQLLSESNKHTHKIKKCSATHSDKLTEVQSELVKDRM